jgi:cytoskeletal protein CcmA (bactofilin family)
MGTYREQKILNEVRTKNGTALPEAVVGAGVTFKGNIRCPSTIRIDGRVEGDIYTDGALVSGEEAMVTGNIYAGSVICQGMLAGDIIAKEEVEMRAPASFNGSVHAPLLSIDECVLFNDSLATTYIVEELSDEETAMSVRPVPPWTFRSS